MGFFQMLIRLVVEFLQFFRCLASGLDDGLVKYILLYWFGLVPALVLWLDD